MDTPHLITELNAEIERLRQVRALLAGGGDGAGIRRGRRPATSFAYGANRPRKRRVLSAAARAKIAAAQRKRWAKQKAAARNGK